MAQGPHPFQVSLSTAMCVQFALSCKRHSLSTIMARLLTMHPPDASRCEHLGVAVRQGFVPHHAEPDHVTLTAWLHGGENTLPLQAVIIRPLPSVARLWSRAPDCTS